MADAAVSKTVVERRASSTLASGTIRNQRPRICGYFGAGTHLEVESELGQGTTVRLVLVEGALRQY